MTQPLVPPYDHVQATAEMAAAARAAMVKEAAAGVTGAGGASAKAAAEMAVVVRSAIEWAPGVLATAQPDP